MLGSKFTPSLQLVRDVFSNKFPSLRHANLGRINDLAAYTWSTSPSLRFISIHSNETMFIRVILTSCPNLDHLQLHVLDKSHNNVISAPPLNHLLRRFTLWSHSVELSFNDIDAILIYTANVQYFYLQTECRMSFVGIVNRLYSLF